MLRSSKVQPLLLVVENLHWIDAASEACLAGLIERLDHSRILLILTYRPSYHPPWGVASNAMRLALMPLSPDDSRCVVQDILHGQNGSATACEHIVSLAEGNPFVLEELALAVREQGLDALPQTLPASLQALLAARIDQLPSAAKQVLQMGSVVGDEITASCLQALTGFEEQQLRGHLQTLQTHVLLYQKPLCAGRELCV